jgi:hypothetical protein
MSLRPRRLAHRGFVDAVGLLVDRASDEREARARVLARWTPGTAVYTLGGRYAVVFAGTRRVRAERCEGAPLVRCPGSGAGVSIASTAALSRAEVDALIDAGAHPEHLVIVRGGRAETVALSTGNLVDPGAWIDLTGLTVLEVGSLGTPPRVVVAPPDETARPAPAALRPKDSATMASALAQALGAMVARGELPASALAHLPALEGSSTGVLGPPAPRGLGATLRALWSSLLSPRRRGPATVDLVRALPPPSEPSTPSESVASAAPSSGWWARLRGWFQQRVVRSPAQSLLGDAQARYLERMIEMFRQGDLDAALRHALPLGGPSPPDAPPKPVTWSPPQARDALSIQLKPSTHSTGTGGGSLHALLRTLYRDAVTALEREGRIDEAAFTLAELLREPGEAVALLERHGRLRLAAELADTAGLAPELRARQWMLAGEPSRALTVVRRHGVFEAALARFSDDPAHAEALRRMWARHLAAVGDHAAAVAVGSPIADLADEVEAWTDALLALGGPAGIRVMVRRLADRPDGLPALRARVEALAEAEGVEALADRAVFARVCSEVKPSAALALAARMLARPQARDAARSGDPDDLQTLRALVTLAQDPTLREDVPAWPTFARVPLASRPTAWKRTLTASDTGPRAVFDAVALRDGGVLLALGEAGASLRDRDGRERARLDDPTHRIVWSDHENSALLLGARGASWRVARLDVARATSSLWGECTLDCFAPDYDGDSWVVGQEGEVLALDATAGEMRALAGPGRTPRTDHARVRCVARDATGAAAVRVLTVIERWRWRLPGWSLLEKPLEPLHPPDTEAVAVHPTGVTARRSASGAVTVDRGKSLPLVELPHPAGTQTEVTHLTAAWVVVAQRAPDAVTLSLWSLAMGRSLVELRLEGASAARGRVHGEVLTACDDRGRVLSLDLRGASVLRDLRV